MDYLQNLQEIKNWAKDLIILQYHRSNKNQKLIELMVDNLFANNLIFQIRDLCLNVDESIGAQLDVVGKWVGIDRYYNAVDLWEHPYTALVNYSNVQNDLYETYQGGFSNFSTFNNNDGGFLTYQQWRETRTAVNQIGDEYFRQLIKLKIIKNSIRFTNKNIDDAIWSWSNGRIYTTWMDNNFSAFTKVGSPIITDGIHPTKRYTVVGSPTITDDGIASGFSSSNYLQTINFNPVNKSWEISLSLKLRENTPSQEFILTQYQNNVVVFKHNGQISIQVHSGTWDTDTQLSLVTAVDININYKLIFGYTTTGYYARVYNQDTGVLLNSTENSNTDVVYDGGTQKLTLGKHNTGNSLPFTEGSIDLKQFSITVDGNEVYRAWEVEPAGIASGFANRTNYLYAPLNLANKNNWEIDFECVCGDTTNTIIPFAYATDAGSPWGGEMLRIQQSGSICYLVVNGNVVTSAFALMTNGGKYKFNFSFDGTNLVIKQYNGSGTLISTSTTAITAFANNGYIIVGTSLDAQAVWSGSIDLNAFKIYVDGNLAFNGQKLTPMEVTYHYPRDLYNLMQLAIYKNVLLAPTGCTIKTEVIQ